MGEDGVILITGTRRADEIAVLEHFPGVTIYDIFANGALLTQFGAGNAIHIDGRGGGDVLSAAPGIMLPAIVVGGGGNDRITGGGGADAIDGGPGRDVLSGLGGDDHLSGGPGIDNLVGGEGNDVLNGGAGRDTLSGEAGDDTLTGGPARDAVTGGSGADTFSLRDRDQEITDLLGEDGRG